MFLYPPDFKKHCLLHPQLHQQNLFTFCVLHHNRAVLQEGYQQVASLHISIQRQLCRAYNWNKTDKTRLPSTNTRDNYTENQVTDSQIWDRISLFAGPPDLLLLHDHPPKILF